MPAVNNAQPKARRGVILLVVIVLLALFAVVGLAFVFYAQSQADAARVYREAQTRAVDVADVEPGLLLGEFLRQWSFDVYDTTAASVTSGLRGHSLARGMFGYNYDTTGTPPLNNQAFNGTGRVHDTAASVFASDPAAPLIAKDDYNLINYTWFKTADTWMRDPERLNQPTKIPLRTDPTVPATAPFTGGFNAPYTYPDLNTLCLAAVQADGTVLMPSFHRPWLFGSYDTTNANWTNTYGKYLTLRPRPADNLDPATGQSQFPAPIDPGGDVQNLLGSPGFYDPATNATYPHDSWWIDIGYPVSSMPDGRKFKPLFAALIIDLNNRINLNVDGNVRGRTTASPVQAAHTSNQGWGPWEINLSKVLTASGPNTLPEWTNLFLRTPWVLTLGAQTSGTFTLTFSTSAGGQTTPPIPYNAPAAMIQTVFTGLPNVGSGNATVTTNASGALLITLLGTLVNQPGIISADFSALSMPAFASIAQPSFGRYGVDLQPTQSGNIAPQGNTPHFYGQVDYDGCNEQNGYAPSAAIVPPTLQVGFPDFTAGNIGGTGAGYGNGYYSGTSSPASERTNHPLLYNLFRPGGDDIAFDVSNTRALVRDLSSTNELANSTLGKLCPTNFANTRIRGMTTTISFDVDRPGLTPWLYYYDSTTQPTYDYTYSTFTNQQQAPAGPPIPFPALATRYINTNPPAGPEFSQYWKGMNVSDLVSVLPRVNLNRFLPPYPHMGQGTTPAQYQSVAYVPYDVGRFDDAANANTYTQFAAAQTARQNMAFDIYTVLKAVTGARNPVNNPPSDAELAPLRWLAQLAVNIVDFIDEDEVSTPFHYLPGFQDGSTDSTTGGTPPRYWVFGTELPRIVLNEALAEYVPGVSNDKVWVELYNPAPATLPANPPLGIQQGDTKPIPLVIPSVTSTVGGTSTAAYAPYRVAIIDGTQPWPTAPGVNNNANGEPPAPAMTPPNPTRAYTQDADFTALINATPTIGGTNTTGAPNVPNSGFCIVGATAFPGQAGYTAGNYLTVANGAGGPAQLVITPNMEYAPPTPNDTGANGVFVALRRLADPHLPFNANPGTAGVDNPLYNPYVTIDYLDKVQMNAVTPPTATDFSQGKYQPYAADPITGQVVNQTTTTGTRHTFGALNQPFPNNPWSTANSYDWLAHLDRQLISPMELTMVSGYAPHQLTHQFISGTSAPGSPNQHVVPWFDNNRRLYRAFEFLRTHNRASGIAFGARNAGGININTLWDPEPLKAVCDAQSANNFADTDIVGTPASDATKIWGKLIARRTPGLYNAPAGALSRLSSSDLPFGALSTGVDTTGGPAMYPGGIGIDNTLLAAATAGGAPTSQRLFEPPSTTTTTNPYWRYQLLNKVFNHFTTRSNTFALWLTVGFFEVVDSTTTPVKLGAEINANVQQNIRHHMFAIVDRSALTVPVTGSAAATSSAGISSVGVYTISVNTIPVDPNIRTAPNMQAPNPTISPPNAPIQEGSVITVDVPAPGQTTNQETVTVMAVDSVNKTITASFRKVHPAGFTIYVPNFGNPGPQPLFLPQDNSAVVPYFAVID